LARWNVGQGLKADVLPGIPLFKREKRGVPVAKKRETRSAQRIRARPRKKQTKRVKNQSLLVAAEKLQVALDGERAPRRESV